MSLFLFASVSQDALMLSCTALAASLCSRAVGRDRALSAWECAVVAVLIGAAIAARPPYVALLAMLVVPVAGSEEFFERQRARVRTMLSGLAALAIGSGWVVFGARLSQTPMRLEAGVSIPSQVSSMLSHPASFPEAFLNTAWDSGREQLQQTVGVLGWTDTPLPFGFYVLIGCTIGVAVLATLIESDRGVRTPWGAVLLGAFGLAVVGIYAALYLSWTPVGANSVDGIQGRYFLPAASLLALAVPSLGSPVVRRQWGAGRDGSSIRPAVWLALFALTAASDLWLPHVVFVRYFG